MPEKKLADTGYYRIVTGSLDGRYTRGEIVKREDLEEVTGGAEQKGGGAAGIARLEESGAIVRASRDEVEALEIIAEKEAVVESGKSPGAENRTDLEKEADKTAQSQTGNSLRK